MNPEILKGFAVLVVAALLLFAGFEVGDGYRALKDQEKFDSIDDDIAEQKRLANNAAIEARNNVITLTAENTALKTKLETDHVNQQKVTDDLRRKLSSTGLRFRTEEASRCWKGDGLPNPTESGSAGNSRTAEVQLPAEVTGRLRELTFDADRLRDDYTLLYEWAHSGAVRCSRG